MDNRVSDGPYMQLASSFFEWFERWLDDIIAGGDGCWWFAKESDEDKQTAAQLRPWWRRILS
jgi:hypothetical protein